MAVVDDLLHGKGVDIFGVAEARVSCTEKLCTEHYTLFNSPTMYNKW